MFMFSGHSLVCFSISVKFLETFRNATHKLGQTQQFKFIGLFQVLEQRFFPSNNFELHVHSHLTKPIVLISG